MAKRRTLDLPDTPVSVPATQSEEPRFRPLDVPPQVAGSLAGLAGFMGLDVKCTAFAERTADGARHLKLVVGPKAQGKDEKRHFAAALSDGPVTFTKQDGIGLLVHDSGNQDFYHACRRCIQVSSTLQTMARHVDVVTFELAGHTKAKPSKRPPKRVSPQHMRR